MNLKGYSEEVKERFLESDHSLGSNEFFNWGDWCKYSRFH